MCFFGVGIGALSYAVGAYLILVVREAFASEKLSLRSGHAKQPGQLHKATIRQLQGNQASAHSTAYHSRIAGSLA